MTVVNMSAAVMCEGVHCHWPYSSPSQFVQLHCAVSTISAELVLVALLVLHRRCLS